MTCYDLGGGFTCGSFGEKSASRQSEGSSPRRNHTRVVVKAGSSLVESVISHTSAEELGLKKGDSVRVVVKSTDVMIQKD